MRSILVSIKLVIFGINEDSLTVFLSDNTLPKTEVKSELSLDKQVEQLFLETTQTNLGLHYVEQLYTISSLGEVTIVYYILVPLERGKLLAAGWRNVSDISKNAHDKSILTYAVQRLRWKIEYTNVVYSLLPKEFTLSELQKTYEAILGQTLDKRNFRKKILSLTFLEPTGKKRVGVSRPAQMYTFKKRKPTMVKIFS